MTTLPQSNATGSAMPGPAPGPRSLTKDQMAAISREMYSGFGQVTTVLMRSVDYKHAFLTELEWLVIPSVVSSQFSVASAEEGNTGLQTPRACVLWAHVSEAVDRRLSANAGKPRLHPNEWTSGNIAWLIDAVGDPRATGMLLKAVVEQRFAKTGLKTMQRGADGQFKLQLLSKEIGPATVAAGTA